MDRTTHKKSTPDLSSPAAISSSCARLRLAWEPNATYRTGRFMASLESSQPAKSASKFVWTAGSAARHSGPTGHIAGEFSSWFILSM